MITDGTPIITSVMNRSTRAKRLGPAVLVEVDGAEDAERHRQKRGQPVVMSVPTMAGRHAVDHRLDVGGAELARERARGHVGDVLREPVDADDRDALADDGRRGRSTSGTAAMRNAPIMNDGREPVPPSASSGHRRGPEVDGRHRASRARGR